MQRNKKLVLALLLGWLLPVFARGLKMPSDALLRFQKTVCPDTPLNDSHITEILMNEIAKLKAEVEG